jgi:hypothetical protein
MDYAVLYIPEDRSVGALIFSQNIIWSSSESKYCPSLFIAQDGQETMNNNIFRTGSFDSD